MSGARRVRWSSSPREKSLFHGRASDARLPLPQAAPPGSPMPFSGTSAAQPPAIEVRDVRRVYRGKPDVVALGGVDLEVAPGEFFGLVGPNGAGKTTLIKIMTTLLSPTSGSARIFGFDVEHETKRIRRIMNMVAGGEQSGYGILEVREQLWMFGQFCGLGIREAWKRVDELIEAVGLREQAH